MTNRQILWDGTKAVAVDALPDSAWRWYTPHVSEEDDNTQEYYQRVGWLSRGVSIRANALASLPFAIMRGETEVDASGSWQNAIGFLPNPGRLLYLVEASLCLLAEAYLFKLRSARTVLDVRYILASSIEPVFADQASEDVEIGQLLGFVRMIDRRPQMLSLEDVVYFWQPDPYVEQGAGQNSPAKAALASAGVLYNVDRFAAQFFERGAIKPTLLTVEGTPGLEEKNRFRRWWQRVVQGIDNAWATEVLNAPVTAVQIGEGIDSLANTELTSEKREDISTALGIPQTLLFSQAANYATAQEDRLSFYQETVLPQARIIAAVLNQQLFAPLGLAFEFRPETLDVFQQDEERRSLALTHYVQAGYRLSVASEILGVELPSGMAFEDLDVQQEEDRQARTPPAFQQAQEQGQNPFAQSEAEKAVMELDLKRWERKALSKGPSAPFESEYIPADVTRTIRAMLDGATTDEEVKAAFAAGFRGLETAERGGWDGYP